MGEEALRETEEKDDVWSETIPQPLSFARGKKEEGEETDPTDPSCSEKKNTQKKRKTGEKELLQVAAEDINRFIRAGRHFHTKEIINNNNKKRKKTLNTLNALAGVPANNAAHGGQHTPGAHLWPAWPLPPTGKTYCWFEAV